MMMNPIRRLMALCAFLCMCVTAFSQTPSPVEKLFEDFSRSCVCMGFTYSLDSDAAKVVGKGDLQVQGTSYHMTGNGLEVFSDGRSSWIIDDSAMEVVIEPAGIAEDLASSPALILARLDDAFKVTSVRGEQVFLMSPKVDCGIVSAEMTFGDDGGLRSGRFILDGGDVLDIRITYIRNEQKKDASFFCPDIEFDSDWIVTDMR